MPDFWRLDFLSDWHIQQDFLQGLLVTLRIACISAVCAIATGLFSAFIRGLEPGRLRRWLNPPVTLSVEACRNTPLLIQLYFFYRGLQSIGLNIAPELCGILALSLYTGAYLSEVFRAGLLSIPREQTDAALSLGLNRFNAYRLVLIPQAARIVLPAVGNQLVALAKNSSLVAFITVNDLFYGVYKGAVDHFRPLEYFTEGALLYLAVSLGIAGTVRLIEIFLSPDKPGWWPFKHSKPLRQREIAVYG